MKQVTSLLIGMRIYYSNLDFRILIPSNTPNLPNMPNRTLGPCDAWSKRAGGLTVEVKNGHDRITTRKSSEIIFPKKIVKTKI